MSDNDLIVVLPGIMGSTLAVDGRPVWEPSAGAALRAIGTLGGSLSGLALPDGIGDEHPDDGVEPVALMPDLHVIPGIWTPIQGYSGLLKRLDGLHQAGKTGKVVPVPYDWRLSNRFNARRLGTIVERELGEWRESAPERAMAKVVFVCHSMGGLVARWYIEKCGGAEFTRKLITLGTPYRGAARAVDQLVNGVRKGLGPFAIDLTAMARSLPSIHQLLPDYACIEHNGVLRRLDEIAVPDLGGDLLQDALAFHAELAAAEAARSASVDMTHAIVGVRQPTATSLRIGSDGLEPLDFIGTDNDFGDATVPLAGAIGHQLPMDTNRIRRIVEDHGHLQNHPAAFDEIESVITSRSIRRRPGRPPIPIRVAAPELLMPTEPLTVAVDIEPGEALTPAVQVELCSEDERIRLVRTPRIRHNRLETSFSDLMPGAYEIRVHGIDAGSPVTPVRRTTLVWDPTIFE